MEGESGVSVLQSDSSGDTVTSLSLPLTPPLSSPPLLLLLLSFSLSPLLLTLLPLLVPVERGE